MPPRLTGLTYDNAPELRAYCPNVYTVYLRTTIRRTGCPIKANVWSESKFLRNIKSFVCEKIFINKNGIAFSLLDITEVFTDGRCWQVLADAGRFWQASLENMDNREKPDLEKVSDIM